jgi:hypothetical protein
VFAWTESDVGHDAVMPGSLAEWDDCCAGSCAGIMMEVSPTGGILQ